jgi:glycine/D-amino acid oxidase-like deaminating enzyme
MAADVAVIGGGILGLATAAFLAEAGAGVRLYEREELACGASGRNSGVLQHPLDEELAPIYEESLALYAALDGFPFPEEAAGMLVLSEDPVALAAEHAALDARFPELRLTRLDAAEVAAAEPGLAPGLLAYRLDEARPVPPAAAAAAFAARARRAGAHIEEGTPATPALEGTRVAGVRTSGGLEPAGAVVVAAGPWSAEVLPAGLAPPVAPLWGVVSEVALDAPPLFSLVTAAGRSSVGSSFERERPDPAAVGPELAARAARFAPVLREAPRASVRACARPQSADGRPFLGPVPGVDGLHLATGHGPWGVTLAPGSARRVAAGVLGAADAIPPALSPARAGPWSDPRP